MAIDSAKTIFPKKRGWGRNTTRALAKPFVGTLKATGSVLKGLSGVDSGGVVLAGEGAIFFVSGAAIIGTVAIPAVAAYGLAHGTAGLANSAVKGIGNFTGLRKPKPSPSQYSQY